MVPALRDLLSPDVLGTDAGKEAGLYVARRMGWDQCVVSIATGRKTAPGPFDTIDENGQFVVRFDGTAEFKQELLIDSFQDSIREESVDDDIADEVRRLLSEDPSGGDDKRVSEATGMTDFQSGPHAGDC